SYVTVCFFFQAEDGIRDRNVTGVQTCALPISMLKPANWCATTPLAVSPGQSSVTVAKNTGLRLDVALSWQRVVLHSHPSFVINTCPPPPRNFPVRMRVPLATR